MESAQQLTLFWDTCREEGVRLLSAGLSLISSLVLCSFAEQNPRIPQLSRCQDFSVLTTALSNVELQQCRTARDLRGSSLSPGLIHLENV